MYLYLWIALLSIGHSTGLLTAPSFISGWHTITANDDSASEVIFPLPIQDGQLPVKVIAEVKVTEGYKEYFFNAFGSGPRDNVRQTDYGGVVCLYNTEEIRVYAPNSRHGYVLFLGKDGKILGPKFSKFSYKTGEVRVKVWKTPDMEPSLNTGFTFSITTADPFLEVPLQGGVEPDMVVVQARPVDINPVSSQATKAKSFFSDFISEALGLPSCFGKCGVDGGGLVFAYNSSTLRLWANSNGKIISTVGWGKTTSAFTSSSVQVRILTWHFQTDPQKCLLKFTSNIILSSNTSLIPPNLNFPYTEYSLVLVKVRAQEGVNKGLTFYGSGSVVLSGTHGGGFVFGYTVDEVVTWVLDPNRALKSLPVFRIVHPWGNGKWYQTSNHVEIEINVFPHHETNVTVCGNPHCEEGNSSLVSQNLTSVEYKCHPGYMHHSGDLVKYCNYNKWEGETKQPVQCLAATTPTAVSTTLPVFSSTLASTKLSSTPESLSTSALQTLESITNSLEQCRVEGTHVNYSCNTGSQWTVPVSESLTCQCHLGYHLKYGDLKRTCLQAGRWSGSEPVCIASGSCMCPCDKVTNPKYTAPNDKALLKEIQKIRQELIILKNMTNKALRKKISVPDFRPSATVSGTPWVLLLVAMVLWIVVPDIWTVIQQLKILFFQSRI